MKKIIAVLTLAISTSFVFAADVFGPTAGPPSGLNTALMKLFGKNNAFTATADVKIFEGKKENTSMRMKIAYLEGKIRTDMDMAEIKSAELPAQAVTQIKQMGMDKMASIIEPEKQSMFIIYPSMKSYVQMPLPEDQAAALDKEPKISKEELGKETVDGRACIKNKVTVTGGSGKPQEFIVWTATDLKDFPVKTEFTEGGATITVLYRDIQLGKPDASQFEPPAGFAKAESLQELVMKRILESQGNRR